MPTYHSSHTFPNNHVVVAKHVTEQLKKSEDGKTLSILTGMMGSGKTTLGQLLGQHEGIVVINADKVAKETVYVKYLQRNIQALTSIFGEEIFVRGDHNYVQSVDLRKVAQLFFSDQRLQAKFSKAFGAQILQAVREGVADAYSCSSRHVIIENAIAVEEGWLNLFSCNHIICTICSEENQMARLMKRPGMNEDDHRARIASQYSGEEKMKSADIVVMTDGEESGLHACAREVMAILKKN